MSWDYRFGSLIFISTLVDYYLAIKISENDSDTVRKNYLKASIILNLVVILGFFKYYNFATSNINSIFGFFGIIKPIPELKILLPVGISFFTFQSMSYTIDIYRREIQVEKSFIRFALFVSFFPQLVAGPIVTAKTFLPQLDNDRDFKDIPFIISVRYFIMGYIKKVIISDNISPIIDLVYSNPENYGTVATWLVAILFIIQIYCDFSGYSDMAYGSALLLGYELPENFRLPLIATNFTEFWRRWHISLSTWLRDYLYFSLGGSRVGYFRHKLNLFLTMLLAGLWHGASWNFVIWGGLQGMIMAAESLYSDYLKKYPKQENTISILTTSLKAVMTLLFFILIATLFRSEDLRKEAVIISNMFVYKSLGLRPYMLKIGLSAILAVIIGNIVGYYIYEKNMNFKIHPVFEFLSYVLLIPTLSLLTNENITPFIYFQF